MNLEEQLVQGAKDYEDLRTEVLADPESGAAYEEEKARLENEMNTTDTLTDRELDIQVLCQLWGIKRDRIFYMDYDEEKHWPQYIPSGKPRRTHEIDAKPVPNFTTDANADYMVLCEVRTRERAGRYPGYEYVNALLDLYRSRLTPEEPFFYSTWHYEVGDYSKAALKALEGVK
jgi:hypothetical protein